MDRKNGHERMTQTGKKPLFVLRDKVPANLTMVRRLGNLYSTAKITDDIARSIRERYASHTVTQQALADEYGIDRTTVSRIVTGSRWMAV